MKVIEFKRICVIGCSGSGKSTLSRELGERTGLPVVHLDENYWQPDWKEMDADAWEEKHRALCSKEEWIIDGTFMRTLDERLAAADTIVFLDLPTSLCLKRVVGRTWSQYGKTRADMADGCKERFSTEFLWYVFRFRKTHRSRILNRLFDLGEDKRVYQLKTHQDVSIFAKTFF